MKRLFFTLLSAYSVACVSLPLGHSLSAQEGANRLLTREENALTRSFSHHNPIGDLEELQTKKRDSSHEHPCRGPQGPAGPQGTAGPIGHSGPPGSSGVSAAYGSFFTQQVTAVPLGNPIPLQTSPNAVNRHTRLLSEGVVQLDQAGDYFVEFGVGQAPFNAFPEAQVALSLGGVASADIIPGTTVTIPAITVIPPGLHLSYSLTTIATIVRIPTPLATLQILPIASSIAFFPLGNSTVGLDISAFLTVHKLNDLPIP